MEDSQPKNHQPRTYTREIAWGVLLPAAALGFAVGSWVIERYDHVRSLIDYNAVCCRAFTEYQTEDSGQRRFWVNVIESLRESQHVTNATVARLQANVEQLRSDARARPDPFTGSDGQRLQDAIDSLEKRIERIEQQLDRAG